MLWCCLTDRLPLLELKELSVASLSNIDTNKALFCMRWCRVWKPKFLGSTVLPVLGLIVSVDVCWLVGGMLIIWEVVE